LIATDASTSNLIELSTGVIAKTGTSYAKLTEGINADTKMQMTANRMAVSVSCSRFVVN